MDENLSRGYVQLGKARGVNEFKFSNGLDHITPPTDRYSFVYIALILAGAGFLLPYNRYNNKHSRLPVIGLFVISLFPSNGNY